MLELRPAIVVESDDGHDAEQRLVVVLLDSPGGEPPGAGAPRRGAICDTTLLGRGQPGDRVIVNTAALDLGLGSGGFDVVHVNLSRGLRALQASPGPGEPAQRGEHPASGEHPAPGEHAPPDRLPSPAEHAHRGEVRVRRGPGRDPATLAAGVGPAHVMKLNYTSLQHAVEPVEDRNRIGAAELTVPLGRPVAALALHGQLAAVAWAFAQSAPKRRLGYVQTGGGALPGGHSRAVAALRARGLLAGHITAGAAFGGEREAITTAGAVHHGLATLGWDAAVCGPGPGIVGSESALGHGGMAALDSAHVALALGCPTLLVARLSGADARARHRPISHHTLTVLDLLLAPVSVALPAGVRSPVGAELRAGLADVFAREASEPPALGAEVERPVRITRHDWRRATVDLPGFAASGLAEPAMGRGPLQDPLFFAAALAGGGALAELRAAAESTAADPAELERV